MKTPYTHPESGSSMYIGPLEATYPDNPGMVASMLRQYGFSDDEIRAKIGGAQ